MKRNYCIDFIKIVLAIFIALGHFGVQIVSSGMVVICFFIISGYFLVRSYCNNHPAGKHTGTKYWRI